MFGQKNIYYWHLVHLNHWSTYLMPQKQVTTFRSTNVSSPLGLAFKYHHFTLVILFPFQVLFSWLCHFQLIEFALKCKQRPCDIFYWSIFGERKRKKTSTFNIVIIRGCLIDILNIFECFHWIHTCRYQVTLWWHTSFIVLLTPLFVTWITTSDWLCFFSCSTRCQSGAGHRDFSSKLWQAF